MNLGDITISEAVAWIIAAAGALAVIAKAIDIFKQLFGKSKKELTARVKTVELRLEDGDRHFARIDEAMRDQEKAQAVMFRGLFSIINHELTGNGDETLRKARDEISTYLTNR